MLACRRDHPLAKKQLVEWQELVGYKMIGVRSSSGNRLLIEQQLADKPWKLDWFYEVRHLSTSLGLVEAGLPEKHLAREIERIANAGIRSVMTFGISHHTDETGSDAWREDGLVARMSRICKQTVPEMIVMSDTCFCEYTSHGHCGVLYTAESKVTSAGSLSFIRYSP